MFEWVNVIQVVSGALIGVLGFFGASKIRKSDAKEKEANALTAMQQAYAVFTNDSKAQTDLLSKELAETRKEVNVLRDEMRVLNKDNRRLYLEISHLHKANNIMKDRIFELEKDNNRKAQENLELKARLKKIAG